MNPNANDDQTDAGRFRYLVTAYNFVGVDPAVIRWWLGMDFTQALHKGQALGHTISLWCALIIDEALLVLSKELSRLPTGGVASPKRLYTMGRFLGRGILAGAQNLTHLDSFAIQNTATFVVLQCPDRTEAEAAAKVIALPYERVPEIQRLQKGEAFVWSAGWPAPIKVNVPFMAFGDYPSAETVQARLAPELDRLRRENVYATYRDSKSRPIPYLKIAAGQRIFEDVKLPEDFLEPHYRFLSAISRNPQAGLMDHYRNVGISSSRGAAMRDYLVECRMMTIHQERSSSSKGGAGRKLARLTPKGRLFLRAYEKTHNLKPSPDTA